MKRVLILLVVALIASALNAETLFEVINQTKFDDDIKKVKAQVEVIGVDVNAASDDGYTPLTYVIEKLDGQKRRDLVTYFLSQKANPNGKALSSDNVNAYDGKKGVWTPLFAALFTQDVYLVKALLDAGADPALAIRHSGKMSTVKDMMGRFQSWSNRSSMSSTVSIFGTKYETSPMLKATSLDVAIFLKDPVLVGLLKAKSPALTANYNLDTLWYLAFIDDLAGFKKQIKAGKVPSSYEVASLLHYGKKDFLSFVDAAAIFSTIQKEENVNSFSFSLVDDGSDIAIVSDYLDKNIALAKTDVPAFTKGLYALPVDWKKIRMWQDYNLFDNSDDESWSFEKIITVFSHQEEATKAFRIAISSPDLDGYYETNGREYLWLKISNNGTQFESRYVKKPEDNKSGNITILDVDLETGLLLCDLVGFGKYWIMIDRDYNGIVMNTEMKDTYLNKRISFNLRSKEEWEAQKAKPEGGK